MYQKLVACRWLFPAVIALINLMVAYKKGRKLLKIFVLLLYGRRKSSVKLALARIKLVVASLHFEELLVSSALDYLARLKHHNGV